MEEPSDFHSSDAPVAQRIERQPQELDAVGSNPAGRALLLKQRRDLNPERGTQDDAESGV